MCPRSLRHKKEEMLCTCGLEFKSKFSLKKYCSSKCYKTNHLFRLKELCHRARTRAKEYNIPFDIDRDYIISLWKVQNGLCAITKRSFDLSIKDKPGPVHADALSLDRIIPKKGYVRGNLRLVTFQINCALNVFGDEALKSMCVDVLKQSA